MPTTREIIERLRPAPAVLSIDEVIKAVEKAGYDGPRVGERRDEIREIHIFRGLSHQGRIPVASVEKARVVFIERFKGTKVHFEPRFVDWEGRVVGESIYSGEGEVRTQLEVLSVLGYKPTEDYEVGPTVEVFAPYGIHTTLIKECLGEDIPALLVGAVQELAAALERQTGFGIKPDLRVGLNPPAYTGS